MEWWMIVGGIVIVVAAIWIVLGAMGFRSNVRGPRK